MFKEFTVRDILPPINIKKYSKKPETVGNIPFVSCQTTNNGISTYCGEAPEVNHCITVSTNGNCFDCFWHNYPIIPSSDVEVLHKDGITDDEKISLYLCALLAPNTKLYSYSNKPKNGRVFDTKLILPVIENANTNHEYTVDDIDWEYMRDRIREMERDRIREMDAYLKVTGLNDYELNEEDKAILCMSDEKHIEDFVGDVVWKKVRIGNMFSSESGDFDIKKEHINGRGIPVVSSGVAGRGLIGSTDVQAKVFPANTITVDMFGNAFFRDASYKMVTHARVFSLSPNVEIDSKIGEYFESKLHFLVNLFGYNNMCSFNKIKDLKIELPFTSTGELHKTYISIYVRAIEKTVIKELICWKDRQLEILRGILAD